MDEYSPKRHDAAQLKFLYEALHYDCLANLEENNHGQANDPASTINLQLNELIEHITTFVLSHKIKHNENNELVEQIDEYLDGTFMLFSSCGINTQDLQEWRESGNRLFRCSISVAKESPASLPYQNHYSHGQKHIRRAFNENRLFDTSTSLSGN